MQRASQPTILHITADDLENFVLFLRDIVQAYTQTKDEMKLVVYIRPPLVLSFPQDIPLRVERGLYELPDAVLHWFKTYHNHHSKMLKFKPSAHDQCLLYTPGILATNRPRICDATCLQTYETLNVGPSAFQELEEKIKHFKHKQTEAISSNSSTPFNGALITNNVPSLFMPQPLNC